MTEVVVRRLAPADLPDVAELHRQAFPRSVLGALGSEVVGRYYRTQLSDRDCVVGLGAVDGDQLVGYLIGGRFRGSTMRFVRDNAGLLVRRSFRRPSVLIQRRGLRAAGHGVRLLARRAGTATAERPDRVPSDSFGVLAVAVAPQLHRRGVGTALLAEAEEVARTRGCERMHLTINPTDREALDFYLGLGWRRLGRPGDTPSAWLLGRELETTGQEGERMGPRTCVGVDVEERARPSEQHASARPATHAGPGARPDPPTLQAPGLGRAARGVVSSEDRSDVPQPVSRREVLVGPVSSPPRPVLGFIGIHAGRRSDRPPGQDETVAMLFERDGYRVLQASAVKAPWLRTLDQVLAVLTWWRVDVMVIAVFSWRSFWIADIASGLSRLFPRRRVVLFLHGGELPSFAEARARWVRRVFDRADRILAPSSYLADAFTRWGYDVGVVSNVIPLEGYRYRRREVARPSLLWMRAFHENYNPFMALAVLARVIEAEPDATLTMAGADHGLLHETQQRARSLGLADHVSFAGYLDAAGKAAAFADHDIFLNTNIVDNTPITVIEAAASGLVPVATRVGGIPVLLTDDVDSRLVGAGDVEAMAGAVLALLDDPPAFSRLSDGARRLAEGCGWDPVRQRWVEELRALVPDLHHG